MSLVKQLLSFSRPIALYSLTAVVLCAQYRPVELPASWEFKQLTPAYAPEDPLKKLGDFQPGIRVEVLEADADSGQWRVKYKRYGSPDIVSLIAPPDLSRADPAGFARIEALIDQFPLLKKQLEAADPWPETPTELAEQLFGDAQLCRVTSGTAKRPQILTLEDAACSQAKFWGMVPLLVNLNYTQPDRPKIVIEVWNKGDAFKSQVDPAHAARLIESQFDAIQQVFRSSRVDPGLKSVTAGITAVRSREKVSLLPNDLRVSQRYKNGEYLILEIESIDKLEALKPAVYDAAKFEASLASNVKRAKEGHLYITKIPMIDQGEKGYCAAATLARVLQYYGYSVDVHAMADLADTEAQVSMYDRGGTLRDDIISSMRRICNSTPFRLNEITHAHPDTIRPIIESGIPILWFVPGHARLLIGIHPENNEIIYSDSWGAEYQYQVASWDYFYNMNQEMWVLQPD